MSQADYERFAKYVDSLDEPPVAIFDLGTRALRVLVAPRRVPGRWGPDTFENGGWLTNLGADVDPSTGDIARRSIALDKVIHLLNSHVRNLQSMGVTEISVIGTAVFRWLQNNEKIMQLLKRQTRLDLQIIPEELEARITLQSLPEILKRHPMRNLDIDSEDQILMIDQGGGSLEVSWMTFKEHVKYHPEVKQRLADGLGTQALRRDFFTTANKYDNPAENQDRISTQIKRIKGEATSQLAKWTVLPKTSVSGRRKVHAFAVGSAITGLFPRKKNYELHGKQVEVAHLNTRLAELSEAFDENRQLVMTVYKALHGLAGRGVQNGPWKDLDDLDKTLVRIIGLPVYQAVLEACGLDRLTISGYGLRYGYYIDRYSRMAVEPDDSGPFAFVSYSRVNPHFVYDDIHYLSRAGYRVWFDKGIKPSSDWVATLSDRLGAAECVIVFLTPDSLISDYVFNEMFVAHNAKKKVIPILMGVTELQATNRFGVLWGPKEYLIWGDRDLDYFEALRTSIPDRCRRR